MKMQQNCDKKILLQKEAKLKEIAQPVFAIVSDF